VTPPAAWIDRLGRHDWQAQTIGKSGASVFRVTAPDGAAFFVKSDAIGPFSELPQEIRVLRWLESRNLPAPRVVDELTSEGRHWLLMTALPGADMASSPDRQPADLVRQCAAALRLLHEVDPADCPFDRRLTVTLPLAHARAEGGAVDESDFETIHLGMGALELYAELVASVPAESDIVVCHGDASMPNFMTHAGQFTGFIDCARLGLADRHQDLVIAVRSITHNFGPEAADHFIAAYGAELDPEKVAFYRMLDEFF
jgi:aminoglycoside 3'-phosphotransferase-2